LLQGLAPISIPEEWLEGFDSKSSFAYVEGEARIRFSNGRAFGVQVRGAGPDLTREVRELSEEEVSQTPWGPFCKPWESYETARIFGYGPVIDID